MAFLSFSFFTINPELRGRFSEFGYLDALIFYVIHLVEKLALWTRLPVSLGSLYLALRRHLLQRHNLIHVGGMNRKKYDVQEFAYRTPDGKFNDPSSDLVGSYGTFFGRNMPPCTTSYNLMDPHPSVVSSKLFSRKKFQDNGSQFNMLAVSWIQFMVHDWVDHMEDTEQVELTAPAEVAGGCPLKSFRFYKTKKVLTGSPFVKTGNMNIRTPWWDTSVIYGSDASVMRRIRTFKDGKVRIASDGSLEVDEKGIPVSGDIRNSWAGFSLLQALFIKEHNLVCDMLKENYPELDDERIYRHARLVTSAVIVKIHTIDWTVELVKTDILKLSMCSNWYGALGKKAKDLFGHAFGPWFSGLIGLKHPQDHGVPYSLTEEFVSVYRMHSLLPDDLILRDISAAEPQDDGPPPVSEVIPMEELLGKEGNKKLSKVGMDQMLVSLGHQPSGALVLWNYPRWMLKLVPQDVDGQDRRDAVDLAALDVYRDRERGVARYNEFRRNLLMIPIRCWEDLTDDREVITALREVYEDDVEKLDLQVGLHAEKKIPGFAISETSFFIFVLMASRRLEADRFFTMNFNANTYTPKGLDWVNNTESLKDVIDRHFPGMTKKWLKNSTAFGAWDSPSPPESRVPLLLRL
ncbi:hypothetical protein MLD38_032850 [Melastoma candidum]|uniref:Uncharacterized protein n=1 Tax=Melastoma candidum TaxID=119954 RepID=A0ACB9M590_9MYRT|nr:hypothetical protein MLD38_032850 [Melastoma candidum]